MCLGFRQPKAGLQMALAARESLLKLTMSCLPKDVMQDPFLTVLPSVGIFTIQKKKALQEAQGAQLLLVM